MVFRAPRVARPARCGGPPAALLGLGRRSPGRLARSAPCAAAPRLGSPAPRPSARVPPRRVVVCSLFWLVARRVGPRSLAVRAAALAWLRGPRGGARLLGCGRRRSGLRCRRPPRRSPGRVAAAGGCRRPRLVRAGGRAFVGRPSGRRAARTWARWAPGAGVPRAAARGRGLLSVVPASLRSQYWKGKGAAAAPGRLYLVEVWRYYPNIWGLAI